MKQDHILFYKHLGFVPWRMKPVHFATSFLLCIHPQYRQLELLNKVSHIKSREDWDGDEYFADNIYNRLMNQSSRILAPTITIDDFKLFRDHMSAVFNNDGAMGAMFGRKKSFGCDYSTPSMDYLANQCKLHGNSGAFVYLVLNQSETGRRFIELSRKIVMSASGPSSVLGQPLLETDVNELDDDYSVMCDHPETSRLLRISELMQPQTEALKNLAENLLAYPSPYSLRNLIIGVGSWLLVYEIRSIPGSDETIFFSDFVGEVSSLVRRQARNCYTTQVFRFGTSMQSRINVDDSTLSFGPDQGFEKSLRELELKMTEHFRYFAVRIGWVQPRSATREKFFRTSPDTLRVLLLSVLGKEERCTSDDIAERLKNRWRLVVGLDPDDLSLLKQHGYGLLDKDADLGPNGDAFIELAMKLGFASKLSDGLVQFSLVTEYLH